MEWKKFSILGHSMGGGLGCLFSATHPEMVESLVMLDMIKPAPVSRNTQDLISRTRLSLDTFIKLEDKLALKGEKVYNTEEEAVRRLKEGAASDHGDSLSDDSARIMTRRGVRRTEEGFIFTRDLRHRSIGLYGFSDEVLQEFARNVKCPHLVIKATDSPRYDSAESDNAILPIYKQNPKFDFVSVQGSHHVHLNSPELIVPHIEKFVNKHFQ